MNESKPKKILVLLNDSDPLLARVYRSRFEKDTGWQSVITSNYNEALESIEKEAPDVILTEIILANSDKTGFDLIENIRGNPNEKIAKAAIVVLTSLGQEADIKRAMEIGATKYLVKDEVLVKEVIGQIEEIIK